MAGRQGRRGHPELLAPEVDLHGYDLDKADTFEAHRSIRDANPLDYDALVLPGGVANADQIRAVPAAVTFAQRIFEMGKPCRGHPPRPVAAGRGSLSGPGPGPDGRASRPTSATLGAPGGRRGPRVHQRPEHHRDQPQASTCPRSASSRSRCSSSRLSSPEPGCPAGSVRAAPRAAAARRYPEVDRSRRPWGSNGSGRAGRLERPRGSSGPAVGGSTGLGAVRAPGGVRGSGSVSGSGSRGFRGSRRTGARRAR